MEPTRIAFLLGSGISCPAGLPSIDQITERVLSGKGIRLHSSQVWEMPSTLGNELHNPSGDVWRVVTFLKRLKTEVDLHYLYDNGHTTNYEDLAHLAAQIYDEVMGRYNNPALRAFLNEIIPDVRVLFRDEKEDGEQQLVWEHQGLAYLSEETANYITDIVWRLLVKTPVTLTHQNCIKDACQEMKSVDLFTVNHDTLLETFLRQNSIEIIDGFGNPDVFGVRAWHPQVFEEGMDKPCLLKLHGSVDWCNFTELPKANGKTFFGVHPRPCMEFLQNPKGEILQMQEGRPVLLIGTFNKMLEYLRGVFAELHFQFYRRLQQASRLIISGYGFVDDGINQRIREWMQSSEQRKIVVIDPNPARLRVRFGGLIWNVWDDWVKESKLTVLERGIQDVTWEEIRAAIGH
jgi:hypothetical protein